MNEDTNQAGGSQPMAEMPLSPVKVQQNVMGQGLKLMRVPSSSLSASPTKITVIPATMRNTPIRIIPAPGMSSATATQIPVSSAGQQRIFIQASPSVQGGMNPVMAAVTSTGQIVHYTTQNIMKTKSVPKIQGKQLQYVQYVNAVKSGPTVNCVTAPMASSNQLPIKSGSTVQMVVIPQAKQDPQQPTKAKSLSTVKPKPAVDDTPKDDSKSARSKNIPLDILLPRKPCNCTKSQCLKLYCECFANGEFCNNCKCVNCSNNLDHEEERQKAIKLCLDRNRDAFRPKIGKGNVGDGRRHNKGCQCKRSGCLKNYCECYEAKISCTDMCRCVGCRNSTQSFSESNVALKTVVDVENFHDSSVKSKIVKSETGYQKASRLAYSSNKPKVLMSPAVIDATCQCLMARVVDAHRQKDVSASQLERAVLEEFGKCMVQIVQSGRSLNMGVANGRDELS